MIQIGNEQRSISEPYEGWVADQLHRFGNNGKSVCVKVTVQSDGLDMILQTPACGVSGGGGGRQPNTREREIFELWRERGLNASDFTQGNLISFLKQLRKLA
jgi:hypothetical protein